MSCTLRTILPDWDTLTYIFQEKNCPILSCRAALAPRYRNFTREINDSLGKYVSFEVNRASTDEAQLVNSNRENGKNFETESKPNKVRHHNATEQ